MTRRTRIITRIGALLAGALVAAAWLMAVIALVDWYSAKSAWRIVWEPGSSPLHELRFLTLMFPSPPFEDAVCAAVLGHADRAMLVSIEESTRDRIGVFIANQETLVDSDCLTWSVSPAERERLVGNLNAAIRAWGVDTDWRSVSATQRIGDDGRLIIRLTVISLSGDRTIYEYAVRGTGVEPERMMRYSSKAAAITMVAASIVLVGVHTVGGLIAGVVLWQRVRRRKLRGA